MRLQGRIAIITGGAAGLGEATSRSLAAQGALVAIGDVDYEMAAATAASISASGGNAVSHLLDVRDSAAIAAFVARVKERYGRIDILINNAGGIVSSTSVVDCSEDDWDNTFARNVTSTFLMSKSVIPIMLELGSGAIVNLGSAAGLAARRSLAAYSASKGAIIALTRQMAADYGPRGIRVNCVCPGPTATVNFQRNIAKSTDPAELQRKRESEQFLKRLGQPADIANAIAFLVSDDAAWITGHAYPVDGGNTAGQG